MPQRLSSHAASAPSPTLARASGNAATGIGENNWEAVQVPAIAETMNSGQRRIEVRQSSAINGAFASQSSAIPLLRRVSRIAPEARAKYPRPIPMMAAGDGAMKRARAIAPAIDPSIEPA